MDSKAEAKKAGTKGSDDKENKEGERILTPPETPKDEADEPPKKKRGRKPGQKNRKKDEVALPELETRKSPAEVSDTYAAMLRLQQTEEEQYEYKVALARRHAEIHGGPAPKVPKPAHMLAASAPDPGEMAELKNLLMGIPVILSITGLESQPPQQLLDQWANGVAKLAMRYNMQSEMLDIIGAGVMTAAVGSYYVAEVKAKKNGTWNELKKSREMARARMSGLVLDTDKPPKPEA